MPHTATSSPSPWQEASACSDRYAAVAVDGGSFTRSRASATADADSRARFTARASAALRAPAVRPRTRVRSRAAELSLERYLVKR